MWFISVHLSGYFSLLLVLSCALCLLAFLPPTTLWCVGSGEPCTSFLIRFFPCLGVSVFQCGVCPSICWYGVCWARLLVCMPGRIYVDLFACLYDFFLSFFNHGKNIYITKFAILRIFKCTVQWHFTFTLLHNHITAVSCVYLWCTVSVCMLIWVWLSLCVCLYLSVRVCVSVSGGLSTEGSFIGPVHACRVCVHRLCSYLSLSLTVWVCVWGSYVPMRGLLQCVSVSLCPYPCLSVSVMLGPCQPMSALVLSMSLCVSVSCGSVCLYVCLNVYVQDCLCQCLSMTGSLSWRGDFCV